MDILIDIGNPDNSLGMATGPVVGYIHQYRLIRAKQSVGTFSIDICLILLFANILRLNFYLFNQYQTALLFQSFNMIIAQICLVYICVKYNSKKVEVTLSERVTAEGDEKTDSQQQQQKFWRWKSFSSYAKCILKFILSTFLVSIFFKVVFPQFKAYGIVVGLVALLSESILILPQIVKNIQGKSTKGLSQMLMSLNLSGDIFKLIYFLLKKQSFQFILCGIIQVCLDSFVIMQIVYYKCIIGKKFVKENRSLVMLQKKQKMNILRGQAKSQTQSNFDEIQIQIQMEDMKKIEGIISPQAYADQQNQTQFDVSYMEKHKNQQEEQQQYNSSGSDQMDDPSAKQTSKALRGMNTRVQRQIQNESQQKYSYGRSSLPGEKSSKNLTLNKSKSQKQNVPDEDVKQLQKKITNNNNKSQSLHQSLPQSQQTKEDV